MKSLVLSVVLSLAACLPLAAVAGVVDSARTVGEAYAIIGRFTSGTYEPVLSLSLPKTVEGHDQYIIGRAGDRLHIKASSGVALCHAFYVWVRHCRAGMLTWSGSRFDASRMRLPDEPVVCVSPYRDHQYLNVVTFGYSMPYWSRDRWDAEIDWMALHGIDMPLALTGQEAVERILFRKLGLSEHDVKAWETGAAHLPWKRMGNLAGDRLDGPLNDDWLQGQVELQRHILRRYRTLGMKPVCPAFSGFVPKAFGERFGEAESVGWDWIVRDGRMSNYRLSPSSKWFTRLGQMFVETWDSVFGPSHHYLSDSFNEMAIPADSAVLTAYGDSIWASIHRANPQATWVMQGWTVGYQRKEWGNARLEALVRHVPDDRFMLLDMATDYNHHFWRNGNNWDVYPGFYGKEWVWSVIPNMGGKTAMTGRLDYYANGRLEALRSDKRGRLTGYGFAPEGIENNEMLYELICDGGWTDRPIDLDRWLLEYAVCRYGVCNEGIAAYFDGLRRSVYASFTDHPTFNWQRLDNERRGSVHLNDAFYKAVETLADSLPDSVNGFLLHDLAEATAHYCAGKADSLFVLLAADARRGDREAVSRLAPTVRSLLLCADSAMSLCRDHGLASWEQMAVAWGHDKKESRDFARNARRLVTTWIGHPAGRAEAVEDYSCRMWSGLIRDYYLPRLDMRVRQLLGDSNRSIVDWEDKWVDSAPGLSRSPEMPSDKAGMLRGMIKRWSHIR